MVRPANYLTAATQIPTRTVMSRPFPPRYRGLREIAPSYAGLLSDVWGVVHNGMRAFPDAVSALARYRSEGGRVALITNAPRRRQLVAEQLAALGVPADAYDVLVTSGETAHEQLRSRGRLRIFHVGTQIHRTLFDGLDVALVDEDACELVCCTGLFDDETETPDHYGERLQRWRRKNLPMMCVNPDIVVERGDRLIWCAGALARDYRAAGGTVEMIGKPFAPVYEAAWQMLNALDGGPIARERLLAIGDGAETDLRGAQNFGLDALFVTGGIHAESFGDRSEPDPMAIQKCLNTAGVTAVGYVPGLSW